MERLIMTNAVLDREWFDNAHAELAMLERADTLIEKLQDYREVMRVTGHSYMPVSLAYYELDVLIHKLR
jgi:hypothetical protein